jgi:hypothetical protein
VKRNSISFQPYGENSPVVDTILYQERANKLGDSADDLPGSSIMAAEPGFEPGLRDPKSPVLPLHNSALVPKVGLEPTQGLPPNSF